MFSFVHLASGKAIGDQELIWKILGARQECINEQITDNVVVLSINKMTPYIIYQILLPVMTTILS